VPCGDGGIDVTSLGGEYRAIVIQEILFTGNKKGRFRMGFLDNLFKKKNTELVCKFQDLFDIMEESVRIDAPITRLIIRVDDQVHKIGVSADMTHGGEYFDIIYYFDGNECKSISELKALLPYSFSDEVTVIEDEDIGDPHSYTLLSKRELHR